MRLGPLSDFKIRARDTRHLEAIIKRLETTQDVFSTETHVVASGAVERRSTRSAGGVETDGAAEA